MFLVSRIESTGETSERVLKGDRTKSSDQFCSLLLAQSSFSAFAKINKLRAIYVTVSVTENAEIDRNVQIQETVIFLQRCKNNTVPLLQNYYFAKIQRMCHAFPVAFFNCK